MSPLSPLRHRAPWVAGALLVALVAVPLVGAALRFGLERWPWLLGAGALLLLLAGWLERRWQSRPLTWTPSRGTSRDRTRFRVVDGGRAAKRRAGDLRPGDDDPDEPRWLM